MSDIPLKRLRQLRSRTEALLSSLVADLGPFKHEQYAHGFRRKPNSESIQNDVNVTTTCSCLMALALCEKLTDFYGSDASNNVNLTFSNLVRAPWMSSGLTEDNVFTTTLMIRLFGFLIEANAIPRNVALRKDKRWEPRLEFVNFRSFARKLSKQRDPISRFLFELFSINAQQALRSYVATGSNADKVEIQVAAELTKLVRTTSFYDHKRFAAVQLSKESRNLQKEPLDGYHVQQLNRLLLHDSFPKEIVRFRAKSLRDIAREMSADSSCFGINEYPPAAAVLYWYVDGIARAQIDLPNNDWTQLCRFGAEEFGRQRSLVVAKHAAMMDPVAMAMSACLCARLRSTTKELKFGTAKQHDTLLPSTVELESAVIDLFAEQTRSGIWPKYFPLFHYQDAGSNFCFTFELLEAVLLEFGGTQNRLLGEEVVIDGLERAVSWCDANRLRCSEKTSGNAVEYNGWNSGGNLETLRHGQPESWATAVVHMFLWELADVLSRHIQQRLLESYASKTPLPKWKTVNELLDIDLLLDRRHTSLKTTLDKTIVKTFHLFEGKRAELLRRRPVKNAPLSALLFGPPGTSKTEVAKALAKELNWPLVEIDPSQFLQGGFQNIYVQAETIFEDMMDLCGVVVLFDEMDALVQKRDADNFLDTESKFLTTYMLPKLARLHDRGQLIFLMATNFQASFDDAIKRAGRFDFLLCMGPPTLKAKCDSIHVFFELKEQTGQTATAGAAIRGYAATDAWLEDQLTLYTYGEFLSFISGIADASEIGTKITMPGKDKFRKRVKDNIQSVGLKMDDVNKLKKIVALSCLNRLAEFDMADFDEKSIAEVEVDPKLPAIKYLLDRKQSRRQYTQSAIKS
jgi:hypothetical protein